MNKIIKAAKITAGVVGDPVSHSLSPKLHGFWLKKYHINGDYKAFHVEDSQLEDFIKNLKKNNIKGINLTVPHKEKALRFMDNLEKTAQKIGAVNTVSFNDQGQLVGSNTDGYGFLKHLKQSVKNWSSENCTALIIGAGGAARAIASSLLDDGVRELGLCNRTPERAEKLAQQLNDKRVKLISWPDRAEALSGVDLLVNSTVLGMTGQATLELELTGLDKSAVVYDIVYNPLQTKLLSCAAERGNITVDGLGMLLHQAVPGFKAWFGVEPEVGQDLRDYLLQELS